MPVVYNCGHCRNPVTVPDAMLGTAVACPHCRGLFQTQPPAGAPRPQSPPAQEVLSLDDDDPPPPKKGAFEDLDEPAPRARGRSSSNGRRQQSRASSRYQRGQQKMPLSQLLGMIGGIMGGVGVTVFNMGNRRAGGGFNVKEILIAGVVGGVCGGLGFLIGKFIEMQMEAQKQRRRDDDDDD